MYALQDSGIREFTKCLYTGEMFSMMYLHSIRIDIRLKSLIWIGERRESNVGCRGHLQMTVKAPTSAVRTKPRTFFYWKMRTLKIDYLRRNTCSSKRTIAVATDINVNFVLNTAPRCIVINLITEKMFFCWCNYITPA